MGKLPLYYGYTVQIASDEQIATAVHYSLVALISTHPVGN